MKNCILDKFSIPFGFDRQAGTLVCCQCSSPKEAPGVCGVCCKAEPNNLEGQCWDVCTALSLKLLLLVAPFCEPSLQLQLWKSAVCFLTQLAPKIMQMTVPLTAHSVVSKCLLMSGWVMKSTLPPPALDISGEATVSRTSARIMEGCRYGNVMILPKNHCDFTCLNLMLLNAVQVAWWQAAHLIPRNHKELPHKEVLW